ncbi:ArsR/SmtB family transcription factor [Kitasatospora camelliae]|uniref:Helix-turn-helix domain-containing protein n=1 Tax=Kitasatospora camelliae TaxID=3156397 RepID=A0AAU8JWT3_9ACTN
MKEREVSDVATLKALADPVRLAILNMMWKHEPEPMSVKEVAAAIEESPNKLYRHIRQLEQVELIRVAETRLVSGIVESRYRVAQHSLRLSREAFAGDTSDHPEALAALLATVDLIRSDFRGHYLANRLDLGPGDGSAPAPGMFSHFSMRIRPERLVRLRNQIRGLLDELAEEGDSADEDAIDVTLFTMLYALKPNDPHGR